MNQMNTATRRKINNAAADDEQHTTTVFAGVFGKQISTVLIITRRTKLEILGHVVHFVVMRSWSS